MRLELPSEPGRPGVVSRDGPRGRSAGTCGAVILGDVRHRGQPPEQGHVQKPAKKNPATEAGCVSESEIDLEPLFVEAAESEGRGAPIQVGRHRLFGIICIEGIQTPDALEICRESTSSAFLQGIRADIYGCEVEVEGDALPRRGRPRRTRLVLWEDSAPDVSVLRLRPSRRPAHIILYNVWQTEYTRIDAFGGRAAMLVEPHGQGWRFRCRDGGTPFRCDEPFSDSIVVSVRLESGRRMDVVNIGRTS